LVARNIKDVSVNALVATVEMSTLCGPISSSADGYDDALIELSEESCKETRRKEKLGVVSAVEGAARMVPTRS
jgi:hypothetical protein